MEIFILIGFVLVQLTAHYGHRITGLVIFQRIGKHHWVVWIAHPAILHGVQDYAIHVVDVMGHTFFIH